MAESNHCVIDTVATRIVDGYPATALTDGRSGRVRCVLCSNGSAGSPRSPWLNAHRAHVLCSCGAVVTSRGFFQHAASAGRPRPQGVGGSFLDGAIERVADYLRRRPNNEAICIMFDGTKLLHADVAALLDAAKPKPSTTVDL
jgi:hypothetical protein